MGRIPLDLTVIISSADGSSHNLTSRHDPKRTAQNIEFSTKYQSGHDSASCLLANDIRIKADNPRLFTDLKVVGADYAEPFQGRVEALPKTGGDGTTVSATGYWSALRDLTFSELYVDQDISRWGEMSLNERIRLVGNPTRHFSFQSADGGLICELPNESIPSGSYTATWFTAPAGALAKSVVYNGTNTSMPAGVAAATMNWNATDEQDGTVEVENLTLDTTERTATADTATRFVAIPVFNSGGATTPTVGANRRFTLLKVLGNHGLTTITASEVAKDIIGRFAPLLSYSTDTVSDTTFEIPQLVFPDPTTPEEAIAKVNTYHLWEPAVWGKQFYFNAPKDLTDGEYEYELSINRGDQFKDSGEAISDEWGFNGVWVYYDDVTAGNTISRVGPLGTRSYQDSAGDATLLDSTEENPLNRESQIRYAQFRFPHPTTRAAAIGFGAAFLAERRLAPHSGEGSVTGYVKDRAGNEVPAYRIRAGDRVKYTHEDFTRRVESSRYDGNSFTNTLQFGFGGSTVEAIVERLGNALVKVHT